MAHGRFLDIVAEIHQNGMMVADINANGHYITPELLGELRSMGLPAEPIRSSWRRATNTASSTKPNK